MNFFLTLVINLVAISAFKRSSDDVTDRVQQIVYDSKSNSYVVIFQGGLFKTDRLYKFNDKHEVIFSKDFYHIWKILINKEDELYIFSSDPLDHAQGRQTVRYLKPNSNTWALSWTKYNILFKFDSKGKYNDSSYFIDRDGYIFFNSDRGVAVIKPFKKRPFFTKIPVWVKNLEEFTYDDCAEDKDGNVYLYNRKSAGNSLAVITQESKRSSTVTGSFISHENDVVNITQSSSNKINRPEDSGLSTTQMVFIVIGIILILVILFVFTDALSFV